MIFMRKFIHFELGAVTIIGNLPSTIVININYPSHFWLPGEKSYIYRKNFYPNLI